MVRTTASRWDANELRLYYWCVVVIIAISSILIRASVPTAGPLEPSERVPAAPSTTRLRNHASNTIYGPSHALYLYFSFSSHLQVQPDTSTLHPARRSGTRRRVRSRRAGSEKRGRTHLPTRAARSFAPVHVCILSARGRPACIFTHPAVLNLPRIKVARCCAAGARSPGRDRSGEARCARCERWD